MEEPARDFLSGADSNRWARSNTLNALPPTLTSTFDSAPPGWTNATAPDYSNIALNDSSVWTITGTPGNYSAIQCKFTLAEIPDSIVSIGVTLNGSSGTNGSTLRFWAWNFNASSWTQVGSFTLNTSVSSCSAWTAWGKVFSSYISGSNMFILAALNTSNTNLNVDYIKLDIAYP